MKRWALIKNSTVDNVVEQDTQPQVYGSWVECPYYVGPGWVYENGTFSPPPLPPPEPAAE